MIFGAEYVLVSTLDIQSSKCLKIRLGNTTCNTSIGYLSVISISVGVNIRSNTRYGRIALITVRASYVIIAIFVENDNQSFTTDLVAEAVDS